MFALVIVTPEEGIEISHHETEEDAKNALMRDLYEHYQDTDLPAVCENRELAAWADKNGIEIGFLIKGVELS